jgi:phosphotransferase family enzyme
MVSFEALASLLLPADSPASGVVLEADERWTVRSPKIEVRQVVWGRQPWPSGTSMLTMVRAALARELAIGRARRSSGSLHLGAVHRWPPAALVPGRARNALRAALLGGALVELWAANPSETVLDAAARAAGGCTPVARLWPGSDGSARAELQLADGTRAMLRVGRADGPGDPTWAAQALARLERAGIDRVPHLKGSGTTAGAAWTHETAIDGKRARRLTPALINELVHFCGRLPRASGPPIAFARDLQVVGSRFPGWLPTIASLAQRLRRTLNGIPGVMRHGDLWSGNLLVAGGGLTGVVDWDAWHPSAVPGTDLLHLIATEEVLRTRSCLGAAWRRRPWESPAFALATQDYWQALELTPSPEVLDAVGAAWWAGRVAHSVVVAPELTHDTDWTERNVHAVLAVLGGPDP